MHWRGEQDVELPGFVHGASGCLGIWPGAEEEVGLAGAFDSAARILRDGEALDGGVGYGVCGGDENGGAERDVGIIHRQGAAGRERDAE